MKRLIALIVVGVTLGFGWASFAGAESLGFYQQGGLNLNGPSYGWWYGCTPTSAGMMMGYYDQKGYGGLYYSSLVPGGVAEASTVYGDPLWNALVKPVIASQGYRNDYYLKGGVPDNNAGFTAVGKWNDDVLNPVRAANCLADYMGSGQDWAKPAGETNPNGSTWIYYWPSGAKFYASDAVGGGLMVLRNGVNESKDGMLGMDLYLRSCGYGTGDITQDTSFFTQLIQGKGSDPNQGFTFTDYKAEIDHGRVVMVQVAGHSMFGYG